MRIREPKTTALIFASGKMVVTGAKSEDDSKLASRKYARIIQKLGFNAKFTDFKIQNIVGSCDIKFPIRLEGLASKHHPFSSYEPELFPGLIYRMIKPKIVLLIFVSGKIVLTGAKVREEIYQAFKTIYPTLQGMWCHWPLFMTRPDMCFRLQKGLSLLTSSLYVADRSVPTNNTFDLPVVKVNTPASCIPVSLGSSTITLRCDSLFRATKMSRYYEHSMAFRAGVPFGTATGYFPKVVKGAFHMGGRLLYPY